MKACCVRRRVLALAGATALLAACSTPAPPPRAPETAPPALPPRPPRPPQPPRIGLALGGGAARGFAHIGVIQVLEEAAIRPQLVVGTSAGSMVAALYAAGRNGRALAQLARDMDEGALADWAFPTRGLLRGEALARFVRQHTGGQRIEDMALPLGIVATRLDDGEAVLFRRGDPGIAVRASSAVPAVFQPVRIGNYEYVDGGLVAPVPVQFARRMGAELVLAVDISQAPDGAAGSDPLRMLLQTFTIMGRSINRLELREADIVITPALAGMGGSDFASRERAMAAGRAAALQQLAALRERIAALTH